MARPIEADAPDGASSAPFGLHAPSRVTEALRRIALGGRGRLARWIGLRALARIYRNFPGPFDVESDGLRFRVYPRENVHDKQLFVRGHANDLSKARRIADLLNPGATILDVGANVGVWSIALAKRLGDGSRVIAIEAHPVALSRLHVNLALNGAANVEVVECAVGAAVGRTLLRTGADGGLGSGSIVGRHEERGASTVEVETRPLLDICRSLAVGRIDFLKIDIEGAEALALAPFIQNAPVSLLPQLIHIEHVCSDSWGVDLLGALSALGYRTEEKDEQDALLRMTSPEPTTAAQSGDS